MTPGNPIAPSPVPSGPMKSLYWGLWRVESTATVSCQLRLSLLTPPCPSQPLLGASVPHPQHRLTPAFSRSPALAFGAEAEPCGLSTTLIQILCLGGWAPPSLKASHPGFNHLIPSSLGWGNTTPLPCPPAQILAPRGASKESKPGPHLSRFPVLTPSPSPHGPWAGAATPYTHTHTCTLTSLNTTPTQVHTLIPTHRVCSQLCPCEVLRAPQRLPPPCSPL